MSDHVTREGEPCEALEVCSTLRGRLVPEGGNPYEGNTHTCGGCGQELSPAMLWYRDLKAQIEPCACNIPSALCVHEDGSETEAQKEKRRRILAEGFWEAMTNP